MFDEEGTKDFFRRSSRMFDELRDEEKQEQQGTAHQQVLAERRERIATAALQALLAGQPGAMPTPPKQVAIVIEEAVRYANMLIGQLDWEEARDAD